MNLKKSDMIVSDRNIPLICQKPHHVWPTITAENYLKWYTLFILHPNGRAEPLTYLDLAVTCPPNQIAYHDHVPNPSAVAAYANYYKLAVDDRSFEVMVGRWFIEIWLPKSVLDMTLPDIRV